MDQVKPLILARRETEVVSAAENVWALQEATVAYNQEIAPQSASKAV